MEPRYNELEQGTGKICSLYRGSFSCILLLYCWGRENRSLYRGLRYIEVRYIEVPLYFGHSSKKDNHPGLLPQQGFYTSLQI